MKNASVFFFSLILLCGSVSFAFDVPKLTGPIIDEANLLSPQQEVELGQLIRSVHDRGIAQVQVAILKNLQGDVIESASIKMTDAWKLGDPKKDNGILFLVAFEEKKMRIEVGQGLEGDIPDVIARKILDSYVQPFFKEGRFPEGIRNGVLGILTRIDPELIGNTEAETRAPARKKNSNWMFFIYLVIFIIISLMRSTRSALGGRRGWSSWGGGSGGFGGGGGGGWSGGGGGFSGGGSSSGW